MGKRPPTILCKCGGSKVHHTSDPDGCWCATCLPKAEESRCQVFDPQEPEPKANARRTDPQTSHDAAAYVTPRVRNAQQVVLNALKVWGPMTDEELFKKVSAAHTMSDSGCRTRRSELVARGMVRNTGKSRTTVAGYRSIVWEACDGQEMIE